MSTIKGQQKKEWRGHGIVLGVDGVEVCVRHAGVYVRVLRLHKSRLKKS